MNQKDVFISFISELHEALISRAKDLKQIDREPVLSRINYLFGKSIDIDSTTSQVKQKSIQPPFSHNSLNDILTEEINKHSGLESALYNFFDKIINLLKQEVKKSKLTYNEAFGFYGIVLQNIKSLKLEGNLEIDENLFEKKLKPLFKKDSNYFKQ